MSLILMFLFSFFPSGDKTKYYVVEVKQTFGERMSPMLMAVKEAKGKLSGQTEDNDIVIACDEEDLKNNSYVKSYKLLKDEKVLPIERLKLSWNFSQKPNEDDLKEWNLKLFSDVDILGYMIVDSSNINHELIKTLEDSDKIRYLTPLIRVKLK